MSETECEVETAVGAAVGKAAPSSAVAEQSYLYVAILTEARSGHSGPMGTCTVGQGRLTDHEYLAPTADLHPVRIF